MSLSICSLASGSSGNCYMVRTKDTALLIDAGISGRQIRERLALLGIGCDELSAGLLSEPTAFLLSILNIISPFIIIYLVGGSWKALKGVIPITVVSAVSFYVPFYAVARFVGPELTVIIGSIAIFVDRKTHV